jgi:serine/threonine-protein kinase
VTFVDTEAVLESTPARLQILSRLGHGGMGRVYLAHDRVLNRQVAIKVMIDPPEDQSEEFLQRFAAEAALPGRISHPNVIAIYGTGEHEGRPFFIMEHIPGSLTLGELIERHEEQGTELSISLLTEYLRQATAGLAAVHSTPGLWHRDVKPDNMLVFKVPGGGDGLKLIDFGIAHDPDKNLTELHQRLGTSAWMPPECFLREGPTFDFVPLDHRADLFALGATFYFAFCGRHPYPMIEDRLSAKQAYDSPNTYPAPPSKYRPEIPPGIDSILMKLLERRRDERYQNAHEVLADLDRVPDLPAYVPPSPSELAARHATPAIGEIARQPKGLVHPEVAARRRRTWWWVAALAIVAAAAGLGLALVYRQRTPEPSASAAPELTSPEAPSAVGVVPAVQEELNEGPRAGGPVAAPRAAAVEETTPGEASEGGEARSTKAKPTKSDTGRLPMYLKPGGEL